MTRENRYLLFRRAARRLGLTANLISVAAEEERIKVMFGAPVPLCPPWHPGKDCYSGQSFRQAAVSACIAAASVHAPATTTKDPSRSPS